MSDSRMVLIDVDGVLVPHDIHEVPGDGDCLFSSLAYLLHGTTSQAGRLRADIVRHVSNNWRRFQPFTMTPLLHTYNTKPQYLSDMSRPKFYGTTCELMAVGEMYPFEFQLYENGVLRATYGEAIQGIKKLVVTGNFYRGHFDVLIPVAQNNSQYPPGPPPTIPDEQGECNDPGPSSAIHLPETVPPTELSSDESIYVRTSTNSRRGKKHRKRFTDRIRKKQFRDAVRITPDSHSTTFDIYNQNQQESKRKSVDICAQNQPSSIIHLSETSPPTVISSDVSVPASSTTNNRRGKKRRNRFTDRIRKKQFRNAVRNTLDNHLTTNDTYNQNQQESKRKSVNICTQTQPSSIIHLSETAPPTDISSNESVTASTPTNSRRGKKYRRRFSDRIRKKQFRDAAGKTKDSHLTRNRTYSVSLQEGDKTSVKLYPQNQSEINRDAVINNNKQRAQNKSLLWTIKSLSAYNYNPLVDYNKDKSVVIGPQIVCKLCHAKKWREESLGMCCCNGKVQLPAIQQYPEPLHSLLTYHHPDAEHFLSNIRKYNGCFQMTSFGAKQVIEGNFMPTFKVQGQVYHRIGSLLPAPEEQPAFLQIYFVGDEDSEKNIRVGNFPGVKPELVGQLQTLLHDHNRYIQDFKAAVEAVPEGQQDFQVVINADRKPSGAHRGRFNAPATKEVAILIVGQSFEKRDIVLHGRDNNLVRISETHRAYDALQYPLMFCRGEDGYCINIPQCDPATRAPNLKKTVSAAEFYSYRLMEREGEECNMLLYRNLLNQFLVDMYAKIESERLNFIRNNQKKLRSEDYVHLRDAMSKSDGQLSELGKMVVLPSSFTGGPRYMHERTQDAMTYVRHYGRPDLFITFTCNPKWKEITELLKSGQKVQHRHDIVARIFHLKVKQMVNLLTKGCVFGTTRCYMYSVEWQKRGLPHVHILLWLEDKMKPDSIDKAISAEIPDPKLDPTLHEIIKSNMIHGPCGALNWNSPCMVNGSCSKKYPRPLIKETQTGDDGYPRYRRRSPADGGFTVTINGMELDNRWVVPYNPLLSRTFSAHINVEFCNSVKSIKYVCKYINKGSDQAAFTIEMERDEVTRYETGRYISSSEAVWRILRFPIHDRYPSVMHLAVHLENGQRVYFTKDTLIEKINNPPKTTLLSFFDLCKTDSFARSLLYSEVPSFYVWKNNKFCRRKQGKPVPSNPRVRKDHVLGRVYTVHPSNAECYYLRLLLHEVRGPISFTAIKTVGGVVHPTFQSACRALGLLEDDGHWDRTLEEASVSDSPAKIRELFAVMMVFCQVGNPVQLWEKYKTSLTEDIKREIEENTNDVQQIIHVVENRGLILLDDIVFSMSGHRLQEFGLPSPSREHGTVVTNREYLRELSYDSVKLSQEVAKNVPKLNEEQRKVFDQIETSISSNTGRLFFLDAPGGTGKTFLINLILAKVRSGNNIAIAVASSGIAATLLDGGKTAHSAFKLPLNLNHAPFPLCNISKQSDMAHVLRDAKLIVWDECTMANKGGVEALDRTLQDIRNSASLMGGMTVLLAGDFRQTLPVVPRGTRADEVNACLKSSVLWPKVKILSLKTNMRVHLKGDSKAEAFSETLLKIGDGKLEEENGKVIIPVHLCNIVENLNLLTGKVYPGLNEKEMKDASWLRERAILTPTNDSAFHINNSLLEKLHTEMVKYESVDSVVEVEDTVHYPVEFLHSLDPPGIPPHVLCLKVGAPIMLLRNLNPPRLCNGTRLLVKSLKKHVIEATISTGIGQGETVFIPRIPLIPSDYHLQFKRLQFPIKVCYAMTINKAQGQSLKVAGVDLRSDCFSHGQLYVACSRVSSPESLIVLQPEGKTKNVVYKEVLGNNL